MHFDSVLSSAQSAVGGAHQESVSTATNEHARIDHQPSQQSSSARNEPSSIVCSVTIIICDLYVCTSSHCNFPRMGGMKNFALCLHLRYFCLYGPLNCISFHKFSQQLSVFSLCSSGPISALLVLLTIYLFMKVSFSLDITPCG